LRKQLAHFKQLKVDLEFLSGKVGDKDGFQIFKKFTSIKNHIESDEVFF
jgi:hypothetical protein